MFHGINRHGLHDTFPLPISHLAFKKTGQQVRERISTHALPAAEERLGKARARYQKAVGDGNGDDLLESLRDGGDVPPSYIAGAYGVGAELDKVLQGARYVHACEESMTYLKRIVDHIEVERDFDLSLVELHAFGW